MGKRFAIYTSAFVFLLSSVAFLCPDVYSFSTVSHHSSRAGKMPDRDPCGNSDNKASPSPRFTGGPTTPAFFFCRFLISSPSLFSFPFFASNNLLHLDRRSRSFIL